MYACTHVPMHDCTHACMHLHAYVCARARGCAFARVYVLQTTYGNTRTHIINIAYTDNIYVARDNTRYNTTSLARCVHKTPNGGRSSLHARNINMGMPTFSSVVIVTVIGMVSAEAAITVIVVG